MEGKTDTRFKPGQSGNPAGRPRGSRSKLHAALDEKARGEAEEILERMIRAAKAGDTQAGRIILERLWPTRKGTPITFDLPEVLTADQLLAAIAAVNRQVAEGEISPDEGALIVGLLGSPAKAIETSELAERLAVLERKLNT